jgi:hypothetical protein
MGAQIHLGIERLFVPVSAPRFDRVEVVFSVVKREMFIFADQ